MLNDEFCRALTNAYALGAVQRIERVHNGNNRVYRLRCRALPPYDDIAVKVTATGSRSPEDKRVERAVLDRLRDVHAIAFVPRLLPPAGEGLDRPAAWQWRDDSLVSCYRWVDTGRYRGRAEQRAQAGRRYTELRQAFDALAPADGPDSIGLVPHRLWRVAGERLRLVADFSFANFGAFIGRHAQASTAGAALAANRVFLETEIADLHLAFNRHDTCLQTGDLRLIHGELSPSNFGFAGDHGVGVIFDFDSICLGLPLQDIAWLCATFCVDHRRSPAVVIGRLAALLSAIASVAPLPEVWREQFVPFMRLGYLDTIHRKIGLAQSGIDTRLGFVREDIACLRWLRKHGEVLMHQVFMRLHAAA